MKEVEKINVVCVSLGCAICSSTSTAWILTDIRGLDLEAIGQREPYLLRGQLKPEMFYKVRFHCNFSPCRGDDDRGTERRKIPSYLKADGLALRSECLSSLVD